MIVILVVANFSSYKLMTSVQSSKHLFTFSVAIITFSNLCDHVHLNKKQWIPVLCQLLGPVLMRSIVINRVL